jgi:hypothetical protein
VSKTENKDIMELLRGFSWKRSRTFRDLGAPVATPRFPNTFKCCVLKLSSSRKKTRNKERSSEAFCVDKL